MIKLNTQLPSHFYLAFSGGVDSLAVAHFLKRGNKKFTLLHFDHGCEYSDNIRHEVEHRAQDLGLNLVTSKISSKTNSKKSLEAHWRDERYDFFNSVASVETPVITCHHLDDAVESWVWSSLHGKPHIIKPSVSGGTILRPFLMTEKEEFERYAKRNGLRPVDDPFNRDYDLTRNYIRSNIIPHAYAVNPGLKKVILKKYLEL